MKSQRNRKTRHAICASVALLIFAAVWNQIPLLRRLEKWALDFRYAHFNRETKASDQVVVIDLDEQSLKLLAPSYGRWPWPRRVYKELLSFLSIGEPKVILFDILFTEGMLNSQDDAILGEASRQLGNVSHAMNLFEDRAEEGEGRNPLPQLLSRSLALKWKGFPTSISQRSYLDYSLPAKPLLEGNPKIHVVTFPSDEDGMFRKAPLFYSYGSEMLPSLALSAILAGVSQPELERVGSYLKIHGVTGNAFQLPLQDGDSIALHFYRIGRDPQSIPIAPVIASARELELGKVESPEKLKVNPLEFQGKIVIIGSSAVGLDDLKRTPVHPTYPGSKLQATAISNILQKDFLQTFPASFSFFVAVLFIICTYFCLTFFEPIHLRLSVPVAIMGLYGSAAFFFFRQSIGLPMAMPLGIGAMALIEGLAYSVFIENAAKKQLVGTLSKYLSVSVTKELLERGEDPRAEIGRQEEISILFSDIRNFTSISERFGPEIVVSYLNQYLGKMVEVVFENGGTLDKFIGDAIMAFWGAPLKEERHAYFAVKCALGMQEALAQWRATLGALEAKNFAFQIGVGINTGKAVVGNIGSERRLDYTVIGDNVNLASRIEGLTKNYGVGILIGSRTYQAVQKEIFCRLIDPKAHAKGKEESLFLYEPICEMGDSKTQEQEAIFAEYEVALQAFEAKDFDLARMHFSKVDQNRKGGDGPSRYFLSQCQNGRKYGTHG